MAYPEGRLPYSKLHYVASLYRIIAASACANSRSGHTMRATKKQSCFLYDFEKPTVFHGAGAILEDPFSVNRS
jgi:hypothetical protein